MSAMMSETRQEHSPQASDTGGGERAGLRWPTVESVLWILLAAAALALRLVNLGRAPLSPHEAREALAAWHAVTGQGMPTAGYSPLLLVGNALLFTLLGASDVTARLWSGLAGTAVVLVPLLYRRRIGRAGALAAGLYLAISPTLLFASRQLDGAVLAALAVGGGLGGALRFLETGRRYWLAFSATVLVLGLSGSPAAWGALIPIGLGVALVAWNRSNARWLWQSARPHIGYVIAAVAIAGFALCTGVGWNVSGLGATGDLFLEWSSQVGARPEHPAFLLLLFYEPLALVLGVAGLIWASRRGRRLGLLLGAWAVLGILLMSLVPPSRPVEAAWLVVPLALLGGMAAEAMVRAAPDRAGWRRLGIYGLIALSLWVYFHLRITRYALYGDSSDLLLSVLALIFPALLLILVSLVFVFTSGQQDQELVQEILTGSKVVLHGAVAGTLVALLLLAVSTGWGVSHVRPTNPTELLVFEPTSLQVRTLLWTLHDISWRETGTSSTLRFLYRAPGDSVAAWYLRTFPLARRVDDLRAVDQESLSPVLVTVRTEANDKEEAPEWGSDDAFVGQDFVLHQRRSSQRPTCYWERDPDTDKVVWQPNCTPLARWLFLRQLPQETQATEWVELWVR